MPFLVVLSGNVAAQTGIPVANLFGLVISAHSGFRINTAFGQASDNYIMLADASESVRVVVISR
jgi:hypothetical protein